MCLQGPQLTLSTQLLLLMRNVEAVGHLAFVWRQSVVKVFCSRAMAANSRFLQNSSSSCLRSVQSSFRHLSSYA